MPWNHLFIYLQLTKTSTMNKDPATALPGPENGKTRPCPPWFCFIVYNELFLNQDRIFNNY